ncbi:MAG: Crp/Fnr family transcriptional regulator [Proteobacteria bacterium]|nr:Crp/Fnr family transcriptional regulator [Pseudomonadota bacterium]MCP4919257.1 Crp/Fnr family transcriptional regulator [Pseudomonadota bacterium]
MLLPFDDREVVLGKIQPGHWVGEVQLTDGGEATVTIRASEPAAVVGLDGEALDALAEADPDAASALLSSIARDLATRLRRTSTGLIEQTGDGWKLKKPEARRGWFEQALGWLSGAA